MIGQLLTGRYLILEKLGAGGFSETYLARDKYLPRYPLCVVKWLRLSPNHSISSETAWKLFETEASVLGSLGRHHAQIPTLFAYCHEPDNVYLVQEYVEGENLGRWLAQGQRLTAKTALKLLRELLPVLDFLHARRVIHRDIKPSNIIRRKQDGKVVLIDFGAAYILPEYPSANSSEGEDLSLAIGTPGYMPGEQQQGMTQANSDLYALGMSVIHLLTGVHPRIFKPDPISGEMDWHRYLGEQTVEPKLIAILDRMVRVKPGDRYLLASDVLKDLRTLSGVRRAWQSASVAQWNRMARRVVIPATVVLAVGAMGGPYVKTYSIQAKTLITRLGQQLRQSDVHLSMVQEVGIQPEVNRIIISPDNRLFVTAGSDRGLHLWSLQTGTRLKSFYGHATPITALAISPDNRWLLSGSQDGTIRLWNTATGKPLRIFQGHRYPVTTMTISPDAHRLISGCKGGILRQWNLQTGIRMQTLKLPDTEISVAVYGATPDKLISASSDRQIQIWDLHTGQIRRTFAGHTDAIVGLQVASNDTLFSFGKDGGLVWDLNREELAMVFPEKSAQPVAIAFKNQTLATVHANGSLRFWTRKAERLVPQEAGILERSTSVAISPDHRYLISANGDRRLRIWKVAAAE